MPRKLLARFQFLAESDAYLGLLEQNEISFYLSGMGIEQEGQTNYSESLEVWSMKKISKKPFKSSNKMIIS